MMKDKSEKAFKFLSLTALQESGSISDTEFSLRYSRNKMSALSQSSFIFRWNNNTNNSRQHPHSVH